MKKIWVEYIMKGVFTKANVPILVIMILFMEAHKQVHVVVHIGLAIWMTTNPHQIMFSYWEMVLVVGITRKKPLLLCH
jgi:hypothetical protein